MFCFLLYLPYIEDDQNEKNNSGQLRYALSSGINCCQVKSIPLEIDASTNGVELIILVF